MGERELDLRLLLGNHDLWHFQRLDISSVNPLRSIRGVSVIDSPRVEMVGDFQFAFLPYTHDPISDILLLEKEWKKVADGKRMVLGGHISVDGAVWNVRHNTVSEVSVEHDGDMVRVGAEVFRRWNRVFLGHYHAAQKLSDNAEYVGSPLQLSFGEAFQEKHLVVYDAEDDSVEYINQNLVSKLFLDEHDKI